ncbi:hypothetical protein NST74_11350 [Paenibacillus sp. FSL F4-0125]|uniref:hypothetical protein n=1 Tax=Paenibacillus sp. FSL F4-0125 TaxID=2954730 RepID=UPI0030F65102
MKTEQLNNSIETLTPSTAQKDKILHKLLLQKQLEEQFAAQRNLGTSTRKKLKLTATAAALALGLLAGGIALIGTSKQPSFSMVAYAAGIEEPRVASPDEIRIEMADDAQIELPFGMLKRNQAIPQDDGSTTYNTYIEGNSYFTISGKGIKSVTYTSKLGELLYIDTIMQNQDPSYIKAKANSKTATGFNVMLLPSYRPYEQIGNKVTADYYEELGDKSFGVEWRPWYVSMKMAEDITVNPADFPQENITVTVTFTNGKTAVKNLLLSFESDGTLIAKVIERK